MYRERFHRNLNGYLYDSEVRICEKPLQPIIYYGLLEIRGWLLLGASISCGMPGLGDWGHATFWKQVQRCYNPLIKAIIVKVDVRICQYNVMKTSRTHSLSVS